MLDENYLNRKSKKYCMTGFWTKNFIVYADNVSRGENNKGRGSVTPLKGKTTQFSGQLNFLQGNNFQ